MPPLTIRKRTIGQSDIEQIQATVNEHWAKGRKHISPLPRSGFFLSFSDSLIRNLDYEDAIFVSGRNNRRVWSTWVGGLPGSERLIKSSHPVNSVSIFLAFSGRVFFDRINRIYKILEMHNSGPMFKFSVPRFERKVQDLSAQVQVPGCKGKNKGFGSKCPLRGAADMYSDPGSSAANQR